MPSVRVHKIASVTYRLGLDKRKLEMSESVPSVVGNVVVVRALREKRVYNDLELENGRMAKIELGDVVVGALGTRRALQGFVGEIPASLAVGDTLHILNRGGVIGRSTTDHKDFGRPFPVELLGTVTKGGQPVNIADDVIPTVECLNGVTIPPIVIFSGTGMNSGKTYACAQAIQQLTKRGYVIHGGKLNGIACRRDLIAMEDHGASRTLSFLDLGFPSTAGLDFPEIARVTRSAIVALADGAPDAIFLELGDGVIGDYGVLATVGQPELIPAVKAHVFCACDLLGAWGGHRFLEENGVAIDVFCGPVTDTAVGVDFITNTFGLPALNSRLEPQEFATTIESLLGKKR